MDQTITCTCRHCGTAYQTTIHPSVNVSAEPDLKGRVLDGSLFIGTCPGCGRTELLKYPVLYHDPEQKLMVWVSDGDAAREAAMQHTFGTTEGLEGYTGRIVDDIGSLIEKVKIFDAGLDDIAVEMSKYVTCMEMQRDLPFRFFRLDGADGEITLTYPENGQMQLVAIGFNIYEDCCAIIRRNPVLKQGSTGLSRVDSRWIAQFFR